MDRPKIVCLCGSTRFKSAYEEANYRETLKGNIVLSVGAYMHHDSNGNLLKVGDLEMPLITEDQKKMLDKLHFEKIKLADEILVLNVDGYIGESTRNEIDFARRMDKVIKYLEGGIND
jgi:hypothetical protein